VDLTECYSVYSVEKSAGDGLGGLGAYDNGQEGHPSKARECCEYHEMHRTFPVETWPQHF